MTTTGWTVLAHVTCPTQHGCGTCAGGHDRGRTTDRPGKCRERERDRESRERRGEREHVATDAPSDLLVRVAGVSFHLHKYPLLSRSGRLSRIFHEERRGDAEQLSCIDLEDLPGGAASFELAAKFCYGIAVDLTAGNISGLRCAAEFLEMTEDLEEGNLIFKTEAFLSYVVLSSWRDSIVVLKTCESLSPWAENLQIVRRCSESIAWKACAGPAAGDSTDSSPRRSRRQAAAADWWMEDVAVLRIDHFVRVVTAIKVKGMRPELVGAAIMFYAGKWLPGMAKEGGASRRDSTSSSPAPAGRRREYEEQRMTVESLISITPPHKDSVSCGFLLRLLRLATMLGVAPALVTELEKRVGMQLEQAELADLLIPCYGSATAGGGDAHFLVQEQHDGGAAAKTRVARLLDSYLTEVARDRNLSPTKFQVLAEALPDTARSSDDGLYRAVDSYLKRLCRVMDCQKLSMDACMHAAQNERLPLRVVVQVLFSEQVKLSSAVAGGEAAATVPARRALLEGTPQSFQEGWAAAKKDINSLKFEMEGMKVKYLELQGEVESLQRQLEKAAMKAPKNSSVPSSGWTSGWKKLSRLTKMGADGSDHDNQPRSGHGRRRRRRRRGRDRGGGGTPSPSPPSPPPKTP
ncbi:unnamed protein product [Spirodela intermedia]|uniref:Uncharacterized protein n=1 Tax=Spirodela intermedia TaxID=51605 RepID=A0A7I8JJV1_SPIIN|nr:unnamed protein product [Spirodela intermedia]CAA6670446.1 unnamed protein product [Spirodela intermedia]